MDYLNAVLLCITAAGEYVYSDVRSPEGITICASAPEYDKPEAGTDDFDNANVLPRPDGITDPSVPAPGERFPSLCPVRRTLTPGNYATKRFTAVSGAGRTRLYGSAAFDATLNLEYLLNDNELSELLASYHTSRGSYRSLVLDPEVFAGIDPVVLAQIPSYLSWRWADTPVVDSLLPGRSRVQVNLVATLDD